MKIAVLGTGMVGRTIAGRLRELGHEARIGSRRAGEGKVAFADAAAFGELVFNCTAGGASLQALEAAGAESLAGKVLIDVANPLDHSGEGLPRLLVSNDDSLGEQIQRAFPDARVVKALNTVNAAVMVDPAAVPGEHVIFVCGEDAAAKSEVVSLLGELGWPAERVIDLGGIEAARGAEMYLPLWLRLMRTLGDPNFNIGIERRPPR